LAELLLDESRFVRGTAFSFCRRALLNTHQISGFAEKITMLSEANSIVTKIKEIAMG
jgi:hypothetical protein